MVHQPPKYSFKIFNSNNLICMSDLNLKDPRFHLPDFMKNKEKALVKKCPLYKFKNITNIFCRWQIK